MGFILSNRIMTVVRCQKFASSGLINDIFLQSVYLEDNISVLGKIP